MAEIIDNNGMTHKVTSNAKGNAALTLGIIGTALSALGGLGGLRNWSLNDNQENKSYPHELERKECKDYIELTKQYYEGKAGLTRELTNAFFDSYKRDVDNSFNLYKFTRDSNDAIKNDMNTAFFQVYQKEQNDKGVLENKINDIERKVDVMSAIRPYQDALINCKIDKNALIAAYELQKRTARMIQGELVLSSDPTVTGYPTACNCQS